MEDQSPSRERVRNCLPPRSKPIGKRLFPLPLCGLAGAHFRWSFPLLLSSREDKAKAQKIPAKTVKEETVVEKKRKLPEISSDDFPRGGASGLTPLEYKEIKLQVDAELFKVWFFRR